MEKEEIILQTDDVKVRVMRLQPEEATAFHHHTEIVDTMFGISGQAVVKMKSPDEEIELKPGFRCTVEKGRVHQVTNGLKNEISEYLLIQGIGKYDFIRENS